MDKPTQGSDGSYMSSIRDSCCIRTLQQTRRRLKWSDGLHKIFVKAVAYQGGPHDAKPAALKETMEALGVRGLTIQNIKSHLQKYREKCDSGAERPHDLLGTMSPSKAALDSMPEMMVDTGAVMAEVEMVKNFLMDDIEMLENDFSVDEVQMMEKELINEIQFIEWNSECPQTAIDEYIDGLTDYAFSNLENANFSLSRASFDPLLANYP